MTPYQLKQASIPHVLLATNSLSQTPGLISGAGWVTKNVGKLMGTKESPSQLWHAGKWLEHHGGQLQHGVNEALNKGPGIDYDPTKWHPAAKTMGGLVGMETENQNQRLTPLRAAVWAGGALSAYHLAKSIGQAVSPPKQDDYITKASHQAHEDLAAIIREMEETP